MSQSIRVLIGDDSLELGISWATAFKEAGLYAITRPKMGKVLVDYVITERPAVGASVRQLMTLCTTDSFFKFFTYPGVSFIIFSFYA